MKLCLKLEARYYLYLVLNEYLFIPHYFWSDSSGKDPPHYTCMLADIQLFLAATAAQEVPPSLLKRVFFKYASIMLQVCFKYASSMLQ